MSYIYDPITAAASNMKSSLKPNSNIPLHFVPAPVLMTSERKDYAGPGEQIKKED